MNRQLIKEFISRFEFRKIFNELGWDNHTQELKIPIDAITYRLKAIAIKKEFVAYECLPDGDGKAPEYAIRKKIETKLTPFAYEHIIVFYDEKRTEQIWQWVKRESGKPTATRETKYHSHQDPEILVQKLDNMEITLDEEDSLGITDIRHKTKKAFDVEKVTKEFYTRFKKEHDIFQKFILGISEQVDKDWYSSLMLNRLMFIYFIQRKHFLDNDPNYLRNKLSEVKKSLGENKYFSFYKSFLLTLFHKGLGSPERNPESDKLLGKIPYLNGGLFDVHQLEVKYESIDIPDNAFESIFEFFDQYEWHLDSRVKAKGNEINPDVIGYIFEKYINDRASMGAYYTKEDITDYISKNCIIPFLFDETERNYKAGTFGDVFGMVKQNPDKYIYKAVRHGIPKEIIDSKEPVSGDGLFADLPDEIKAGFRPDIAGKIVDGKGEYLFELRKPWNKSAPSDIGLPTEIYRELIDRRTRYMDIKNKALAGEINSINDFITYNLDIRQFAQDAIENTDDPFFLKELYLAIKKITILDPTCGSGAFLFAALNILEPLYEACIQRMGNFADDARYLEQRKGAGSSFKFKFFEDEINHIISPEHPNEKYFVYKSIILNNLHGVDIMNEAVEIAKLRLFLKLVGTVEADQTKENLGLEPLPDIDFNIKCGNTLVGFVNINEIEKIIQDQAEINGTLVFEDEKVIVNNIKDDADLISKTFDAFKIQQEKITSEQNKNLKPFLRSKLDKLNEKLNIYLARQYGIYDLTKEIEIEIEDDKSKSEKKKIKVNQYLHWKETHQPFHWFSEFYEIIIENCGFDVIIGNPPYVEYSKVKSQYTTKGYETEICGNLYVLVNERAYNLSNTNIIGLIIPSAAFGTIRTKELRDYIVRKSNNIFISYYSGDAHPTILFEGVKLRISILISNNINSKETKLSTTNFMRWYSEERLMLFERLSYMQISDELLKTTYPKVNQISENNILLKINSKSKVLKDFIINKRTGYKLFYHNAPVFFIRAIDFEPFFKSESSIESYSNHLKTLYFENQIITDTLTSIINSSTFFLWFKNYSANRDLTSFDIENFPLFEIRDNKLVFNKKRLMKDIKNNSKIRIYNYKTGKVEYQEFYMRLSKPIIDEIDCVLAEHYCFTQAELDFIINYDIKYRMGKELEEEE